MRYTRITDANHTNYAFEAISSIISWTEFQVEICFTNINPITVVYVCVSYENSNDPWSLGVLSNKIKCLRICLAMEFQLEGMEFNQCTEIFNTIDLCKSVSRSPLSRPSPPRPNLHAHTYKTLLISHKFAFAEYFTQEHEYQKSHWKYIYTLSKSCSYLVTFYKRAIVVKLIHRFDIQ